MRSKATRKAIKQAKIETKGQRAVKGVTSDRPRSAARKRTKKGAVKPAPGSAVRQARKWLNSVLKNGRVTSSDDYSASAIS